jgi:hypothetical protein
MINAATSIICLHNDQLWPNERNDNWNDKPCELQISDHKRKLIDQVSKGGAGKIAVKTGELEALIFTKPKVGYMLNVGEREVCILPS